MGRGTHTVDRVLNAEWAAVGTTDARSGHGTLLVDGQLVATVAGVVERVNRLVTVRPAKSR